MVCGSVNGDEVSCGEVRDSSLTLRMTRGRDAQNDKGKDAHSNGTKNVTSISRYSI